MVKTIKSSMSQARKKMLEQIKNKEESEVKRKKTAKEKYKELRESIKDPEPTPQSFSDKFEEELKKQLKETKTAILAECAVKDRIWGIGLSMKDLKRFDITQWRGQNLLGYALMEVRKRL